MTCQLQKDGMLEVVSFHEQHNHELAPSPMKHMLRSNRKITLAQQAFADDVEKSGVSIKQTIDLLSMQVGGYENRGFLNVDYKNHVNSKRREALKKGDGRAVMDHFRKVQLEDPSLAKLQKKAATLVVKKQLGWLSSSLAFLVKVVTRPPNSPSCRKDCNFFFMIKLYHDILEYM